LGVGCPSKASPSRPACRKKELEKKWNRQGHKKVSYLRHPSNLAMSRRRKYQETLKKGEVCRG